MEKDIIKNALIGYKTVWKEKQYLIKLALVPFIIQSICTAITFNLELDIFSLRFFLIMLPAYFANAWFAALMLRLFLLNERNVKSNNPERAKAIKATILYSVLAVMVQGSIVSLPSELGMEPITKDWQPNIIEFGLYVAGMVIAIWAIRLLWLYIPLSINASMKEFLKDIKGFGASFYIVGVWLLSTLPITIVFVLFPALILEPNYESTYELPTAVAFVVMGLRTISSFLSLMVVSASMAYTFSGILKKYGAQPIFKNIEK
ncbi:MAG: hypothetical protein ACPG05_01850 [Bdellovibrionales bacterium]